MGLLSEYATDTYVLTGAGVTGIVLLASVLDRLWYTQDVSSKYATEYDRKMRSLCAQSLQWISSAEQDSEPSLSAIHYTTAIAYIQAALELSDSSKVSEHLEIDAHSLLDRLRRKQSQRFHALFEQCPDAAPRQDVPLSGWLK